jgi:hypothetical protein
MAAFRPEEIFRCLDKYSVNYVLIGGLAATLHGSALRTGDVDICPARDAANLKRLAAALKHLEARIRTPDSIEGLRFACDAQFLSRVEICNLSTVFGDFVISFQPSGTTGFKDLRQRAVEFDLGGLIVPTASLDDVIRSKEAAGRPKDLHALPELRALRQETRGKPKR